MIIKLAYKNLRHKPLSAFLSWLLLTVSVSIISVLILLQQHFEKQFSSNIRDVDMVIGAKGSPLQLILSAIFHIDAPTGNISYREAAQWMRHPYVASAIPLAYGDSYKGYSIIGTTSAFLNKPGIHLQKGRLNHSEFEVVAGHSIAQKLNLQPGTRFYSAHGNDAHAEEHADHQYTVTGILEATGNATDNFLITSLESIWHVHEEHEHDHEQEEAADKEITAVLLSFRNPMGNLQLPRSINEQSGLMAAVPAIEINRLFSMFGIGIDIMKAIAWGIMVLSGISIFIALFSSLKERKYELALMRTMGASRSKLVLLLLIESSILCTAGLLSGLVFSRAIIWCMASSLEKNYHLVVSHWSIQWPGEYWLALLTLSLGIAAAALPAMKAWFINISKTLSHE